jgi:hypothetical protein
LVQGVLAAVAMLVLTVCELVRPENLWFLEPLLPFVEALVWLAAGAVIVGAVQLTVRRRIAAATVATCLLVACCLVYYLGDLRASVALPGASTRV